MIESSPVLQVFIVRNHLPYEQLTSLSSDLRSTLGENNVTITKANYRMLPELVDSIKAQQNNLLILLTQDIDLDGNLQQQLNQINNKNIRIILYPKELARDNTYFLAKSKEEIVNAVLLFFNKIQGKSTNLDQMILANGLSNRLSQQQVNVRASQINPHQPVISSSFKPLSQMAPQGQSPIGLFVLRSRDKQFNSLMNLLYIKHKNDPSVSFQQIVSLEPLQLSRSQKQILIVADKQANQIQNLAPYIARMDSKVFAIKFLDKRGIKKHDANFHFQTNRIEDIEYLIDNSLSKLNQIQNISMNGSFAQRQNQSIMQRGISNSSGDRTSQRIQMKSAKKISILPSQNSQQLYIYGKIQSPGFQQFYNSLPVSSQVVTDMRQINSYNPIILAPSQACPYIFSEVPNGSKLVLFASTLTPQILIAHPMIAMATSNKQEMVSYLRSQRVQMKQSNLSFPSFMASATTFNQNQRNQNNVGTIQTLPFSVPPSPSQLTYQNYSMTQNIRYDAPNYQTPSNYEVKVNNQQSVAEAKEEMIQKGFPTQQIRYRNSIQMNIPPNIVNSSYIVSQLTNHNITPQRIEEFVIKSNKNQVTNKSLADSGLKSNISKISGFRQSKLEPFFEDNKQNVEAVNTNQNNPHRISIPNIVVNPPPEPMQSSILGEKIHYFAPFPQSSPPILGQQIVFSQPIETQTSETLLKSSEPLTQTMTFYDFSEKNTKTQTRNSDAVGFPAYQTMGDISCSLPSIPQRIYTQKAISCKLLETPHKQMYIERLDMAVSANQIRRFPQVIESMQYQMFRPEPIKVSSGPPQVIYSNQQTIFINRHLAKKQLNQKLCSGVFQIRTQKQAQAPIVPTSLNSSTFINNVSGVSQQPLIQRVIIESPQKHYAQPFVTPVPINRSSLLQIPSQNITYTQTETHNSYPKQRLSYSVETTQRPSHRISQIPLPRISQQTTQSIEDLRRDSNTLQLNELDFDIRTQNGVKVYKRKSSSVDNRIRSSVLRQIRPSNQINIRADHYYNKDQNSRHSLVQPQRHSYYGDNSAKINRISTLEHNMSSRQSKVAALNQYSGVFDTPQKMYRTSRLSAFVNSVPRVSQISKMQPLSNPSPFAFALKVLCHQKQHLLSKSLTSRLRNKIELSTYHDLQSLMQQTLHHKSQNLVIILDEQLRLLDQQLEQMHPNLSIITYSKDRCDGTHVAVSIPEVLSLIQKWYFRY